MKSENNLEELDMSFKEWRIISFQEAGLEIEDGDRGKNYPKKK